MGGADVYMLGLIKYMLNTQTVGIAVEPPVSVEQMNWVRKAIGTCYPIFQPEHKKPHVPGITYTPSFRGAIEEACKDADIVITHGIPNLHQHTTTIDCPIVELAQNSDKKAKVICESNEPHDYTAACSEAAAKCFKDCQAIIYNAVDPSRITPRYGREHTRKMWDLEEKKILTYIGRFAEEKYPEALALALSKLPEDWVGLYVGSDGLEKQKLIKEVQRWIGPDRIYFMDNQYHIGDILCSSDVFILASDYEGLPLSICEAWLARLPTVVSECSSMIELQKTFGVPLATYVPLRASAEVLANAVLKAAQNEEATTYAFSVAWNELTMTTAAAKWEDFLHWAVEDHRKKQRRPIIELLQSKQPME